MLMAAILDAILNYSNSSRVPKWHPVDFQNGPLIISKYVQNNYAPRFAYFGQKSAFGTWIISKRYHQNFLLCNNNEITTCTVNLFNSFCEEVYAVALFKVVQQQPIGKVGNSTTHLWADNFCLQQ